MVKYFDDHSPFNFLPMALPFSLFVALLAFSFFWFMNFLSLEVSSAENAWS